MEPEPGTSKNASPASSGLNISKSRLTRARKRKRVSSDSSSDTDPVLPENLLEVEKNLHASAVKNNLDDVSVKKILKTVVTNDHVLALVKLQEEEENLEAQSDTPKPKLTRSKAKELRKVSPKTPWNLENLELTPIKHIPVKTRPEVTALIAQELPEDEDDEEYDPRADDVPSDDDQTLESCSDLDSQPRTPATPRRTASPRIVKDGPFKVPQEIATPRRKLDMDEEATIALRTRSKLSLSAVPIDHIEGSFVPPDEPPMPAADDVWTEFLQICLNPETEAQDDDDDPEYNVAQDPDAHDEDEEGLENIMRISKKELNDLVTELFSVMPEDLGNELGGKLASETGKNNGTEQNQSSTSCKQEPSSEEETHTPAPVETRGKEKRLSIGKSEVLTDNECQESEKENLEKHKATRPPPPTEVTISVVESGLNAIPGAAAPPLPPPPLHSLLVSTQTVVVQVEQGVKVLPEQIEIYQQQLRQHVQLCASNFLQLFVHPVHWALAPTYKENLETLYKMVEDNPESVANVCNLKPAIDLVRSWKTSVSADTPENMEMISFVQKEIERSRRRSAQNNLYVGDFPKTFMNVVSNSPVFLYPHLLPPMPFRSDVFRKFGYLRCEDELLTLGMDEFWQYVEDNPELFNIQPTNSVHRPGLIATLQLVCKHMFPWIKPKGLLAHIRHVRHFRKDNKDNPIIKFFETREVTPVKHTLLPFNPNLTLYEQPENEIPRIWVRHLSQSSKRFVDARYRRTTFLNHFGQAPSGVLVELGSAVTAPPKNPLPINFTKQYTTNRPSDLPKPDHNKQDRFDIEIDPLTPGQNTPTLTPVAITAPETPFQIVNYSVVNTPNGAFLIPVPMATTLTNSATTPICSSEVNEAPQSKRVSVSIPINPVNETIKEVPIGDHCLCCIKLRRISKLKQTLITDFLKIPKKRPSCPCKEKKSTKYPRATKKLRLLVNSYKAKYSLAWSALDSQVKMLKRSLSFKAQKPMVPVQYNLEEIAAVTSFQLKLTMRSNVARSVWVKKKIYTTIAQFNPDTDDIYTFMENIEKILDAEGVDVYKEFLGFLTMEQADKIGNYVDYFNQECLTGLMKKVEELVQCRKRKYEILDCVYNTLVVQRRNACDICSRILDSCDGYPTLADYVFSLFPHTNPILDPKNQNKVPIREQNKSTPAPSARIVVNAVQNNNKKSTDPVKLNIGKDSAVPEQSSRILRSKGKMAKKNGPQSTHVENAVVSLLSDEEDGAVQHTDNVQNSAPQTIDNTEAQSTDNVEHRLEQRTDKMEVDNDKTTDNVEESGFDESRAMDYEADHSASDDDSRNDSLIINENSEELNNTQGSNIKTEEPVSENVIDTPQLTITKTEVQDYSESEMSMMIMSEDEYSVKAEAPEWKRDEDKTLLEVLKQSLTPEEMKDKTILEIIEQKKVVQLASERLPEKSSDDVRERILYLLEFLVFNEQM